MHTRSHSSLTLSISTPASAQGAGVDTAATPPCFGYHTRLLLQALADSRLALHPANLLQTAWNKQTKPRDLHQPALHSTTIRTPPLLHSTVYLSPYLEHQNHTQHITINACNWIPTKQGIHKHSNISDVSGQEHIPVHPSSP